MYRYIIDPFTGKNSTSTILRTADGAFVPMNDPLNSDCLAFQQWLSEGNTPLPAA